MMKLWLFVLGAALCQVAVQATMEAEIEELESLLKKLEEKQMMGTNMMESGMMGSDASMMKWMDEEMMDSYKTTETDMQLQKHLEDTMAAEAKGEGTEGIVLRALEEPEELSEELELLADVFEGLYQNNLKKRSDISTQKRSLQTATGGAAEKHNAHLRASEVLISKGLTALAHLDTVRQYKPIWEEKMGFKDDELFEKQLRQINLRNQQIREITLFGDQEFQPDLGVCFQITRDCSNVKDSPFRTFDGSCNNLVSGRENWGSINRAMVRNVLPEFGDGQFSPRVSNGPVQLPPARKISQALAALSGVAPEGEEDPVDTVLFMQVGQFLDHDVTLAPAQSDLVIECECGTQVNDNCFPIALESDHDLNCIPMTRSIPILNDNCDLNRTEQANALTAWVDASMIYGLSRRNSSILRDRRSATRFGREQGRMKVRRNPVDLESNGLLLPRVRQCAFPPEGPAPICPFNTGDIRANEQTGLVSMHTTFVFLHNFFEKNLARVNGHWNGERLFQETRKLVTAVWQNIAFNEYLRITLGQSNFKRFQLGRDNGQYNPDLTPDTANGFSAAAMRYGHTFIPDILTYVSPNLKLRASTKLANQFEGEVENIYESPVPGTDAVDALMLGLSDTPAQTFDPFFVEAIREQLFVEEPNEQGFDLIAINIQRARDHGVAGYGKFLEACGFGVDSSRLRPEVLNKLLALYGLGVNSPNTLNNIDLFVGGMSETPIEDGQLGATFTCLVAAQYRRMKLGDRFYYGHPDAGFNAGQIEQIESYFLANVMCDALPEVTHMQPLALFRDFASPPNLLRVQNLLRNPDFNNSRRPCNELFSIDFEVFRDR